MKSYSQHRTLGEVLTPNSTKLKIYEYKIATLTEMVEIYQKLCLEDNSDWNRKGLLFYQTKLQKVIDLKNQLK